MRSLPNCKKPCSNCPFRKDSMQGWLGAERMTEILNYESFVCHKKMHLQCAGHMLINGQDNEFVRLATALDIPLELSGRELIFDTTAQCIEHHRQGECSMKNDSNHDYAAVFAAIDAAADAFEKQHGELNESSNFELYGQQLELSVLVFNKINGSDYQPDDVLGKWYEHGQRSLESFMDNDIAGYMDEALENWNNLKTGQGE